MAESALEHKLKRPNLLDDLHGFDRMFARFEICVLVILMAALIILYVGNIALRVGWRMNIAWLETLLKPAVLWVGLIGASLATRESRHISVEAVSKFASKASAHIISIFVNLFAGVVTVVLTIIASSFWLNAADSSPNMEAAQNRLGQATARLDESLAILKEAKRRNAKVERKQMRAAYNAVIDATDDLSLAGKAMEPRPKIYVEALHLDLPKSAPFPESWDEIEKINYDLGYQVKLWQIYLIIPLSFLFMSFRFFLHVIDGFAGVFGKKRLIRLAHHLDCGLGLFEPEEEEGLTEQEAMAVEAAKKRAGEEACAACPEEIVQEKCCSDEALPDRIQPRCVESPEEGPEASDESEAEPAASDDDPPASEDGPEKLREEEEETP